jgi:transcription termination factor NusB
MPSGRHTRSAARAVSNRQASRRRARKRALVRLKQMEETGEEPNYKNISDRLKQMEETGESYGNNFGNYLKTNLKDIIYLNK